MLSSRFWQQETDARAFWDISGSFGQFRGTVVREENKISCTDGILELECQYEATSYGVYSRRDTVTNRSDAPIRLTTVKSRFVLEECQCQVYSQFNGWQLESFGSWQELVTSVSAACRNVRTAQTAVPFLALWNLQVSRGAAFHLLPFCAWEMRVSRIAADYGACKLLVEMGPGAMDFGIDLQPGQSYALPRILCYPFQNRTDMDCWKIHRYMHHHYPRKQLPMAYNSWLYRFDRFTFDLLLRQVDAAREMGLEYFVIDAGWFGKGDRWVTSVGDWEENTTGGFRGRMLELAEAVRAAGLKFGLWLEPERADPQSDAVRDHPDYFFPFRGKYFLDFGNRDARNWALALIHKLIRHYGIAFIKFDLNGDICYDPAGNGFIRYYEGYLEFLQELRQAHPDLYLSGCSGGGGRMHLAGCTLYDGYWPSDNESPTAEMRIFKDTMLRMPPQAYENWAVVKSIPNFSPNYDTGTMEDKLIACNDATWKDVAGVQLSYLKGYLTGGPICFSCDLTALTPEVRQTLARHIAQAKADREFWLRAEGRILTDTPTLLAIQYGDESLDRVLIQVFDNNAHQKTLSVYPAVDPGKTYLVAGQTVPGSVICREGLTLALAGWKEMTQLKLTAQL